jgi:signal transduction histidine kinase
MQVLVIEDEADVRSNIIEILGSGGFETIDAPNARLGLDLARVHSPDLILCDIKMPDLDGYHVLQEIRSHPKTATIPFIFLSAKTYPTDLRQGMNLGADDYLTKPFRRLELLETISARLKKHQTLVQLEQQMKDLQAQTCQRGELLNTITHDLRAPLTTIKVALQMMDTLPDKRQQYMDIALAGCEQCDELIQNLLDLYQLEAGETTIVPEAMDVQDCLQRIHNLFEVRTCNYGQLLVWDVPEVLPPMVSDTISIQRILVELLNNACKYTPHHGKILLTVRESEIGGALPSLIFTIRNQAEIPAAALPHIFNKFYRVPGGDRRQRGGTGLGLALVQKLASQLGGQIQVESAEGWTTFQVELPCEMNR